MQQLICENVTTIYHFKWPNNERQQQQQQETCAVPLSIVRSERSNSCNKISRNVYFIPMKNNRVCCCDDALLLMSLLLLHNCPIENGIDIAFGFKWKQFNAENVTYLENVAEGISDMTISTSNYYPYCMFGYTPFVFMLFFSFLLPFSLCLSERPV